jgi:hypothetical protein
VIELRKKLFGVFLILLSMVIVSASAFVYETAQHTVTQTIKDIATLTLQNSALGNIEEGATNFYTKSNASSLGNIVTLTTTKDNVYLHFNSDLDSNSSLSTYYATYTITVKFAAVGSGSSHSVDEVACTMALGSSDPSAVTLDKLGTWAFDFEISTTAKQVSSDTGTTVTIVVTAEST